MATELHSPRRANIYDIHFGKMIRAVRQERDLSQQDLGAALGVSFQQVQKYEKGTNRISAARLYEICEVLKFPVAKMFEGISPQQKRKKELDISLSLVNRRSRRFAGGTTRGRPRNVPIEEIEDIFRAYCLALFLELHAGRTVAPVCDLRGRSRTDRPRNLECPEIRSQPARNSESSAIIKPTGA
jgi:transcriptional regulator with XRE-family HTH domain